MFMIHYGVMIRIPRPVGLAKGEFEVPPSFYLPLPDDLLNAFDGKTCR